MSRGRVFDRMESSPLGSVSYRGKPLNKMALSIFIYFDLVLI
jgi:hypothetical protein